MQNVYWGVHGALAASANATILMVGDSWFWYPVDNLAVEIGNALPEQTLVAIGNSGAEAVQWSDKYRKDIDFGFKMYGAGAQVLMVSGGGNDVAGMKDFPKLLLDNCSKATTVEECFRPGQPEAIISRIIGAYRELVLRFRAYNPKARVLMHNYDHAWPTGKGLFGPADWLKEPMDFTKVPKGLRRDLFKELVKRLRKGQLELAKDKVMGPMVAVASAGTLPDGENVTDQWWANELHPTPAGFKRLATKAFVPELKKILA